MVVIGIHEYTEDLEGLRDFTKKRNLQYSIGIDSRVQKQNGYGKTFETYRIQGLDSTVIIDRDGRIKFNSNIFFT